MSFITRELSWPVWKFGVLKLSMISFGILVGAYFPDFWRPWHLALWGFFAASALFTAVWGVQVLFGRSAPRQAT